MSMEVQTVFYPHAARLMSMGVETTTYSEQTTIPTGYEVIVCNKFIRFLPTTNIGT